MIVSLAAGEIPRTRSGVDWLELAEWIAPEHGSLWPSFWEFMEKTKRAAQMAKSPQAVTLFAYELVVHPFGDRHYEYFFELAGFRVWCSPRDTGKESALPNFKVAMSGWVLLNNPLDNVVAWWRGFVEENGGIIRRETVSRVDLACDVGVPMEHWVELLNEDRYIGRAGKGKPVRNMTAKRWETLGFGIGDIQLRIYDKPVELKAKNESNALKAIMDRVGYPFTRVEFQVRREVLSRRFKVEDYNSLIQRGRRIASYLTDNWVRFVEGEVSRTHTTRARIDPVWREVGESLCECFSESVRQDSIDAKETAPVLDQLVAQIVGLCCRAVGEGGGDLVKSLDEIFERALAMSREYAGTLEPKKRALFYQRFFVARQLNLMRRQLGATVEAIDKANAARLLREASECEHILKDDSKDNAGCADDIWNDYERFKEKFLA